MKQKLLLNIAAILLCLILVNCKKNSPAPVVLPPTANAGTNQTIQLPASTATLTGTGITTNGHITAYLWSQISGPNTATIANPGSASTTFSGFIAGVYVFQLMVTDNAALTGVSTVQITFLPDPTQTLTLQPSNNPDERHLWGNSTQNLSGHATELDAGSWNSGGIIYIRGAFKFDLSSIPPTATILTAKLTLYSNPTPGNGTQTVANEGTNNAMLIRRIASFWTAATTTWANQPPTVTTDQVIIPHTNQPFLDLVDVDVKNLVVAMQSSGNYGFMILLQNEAPNNLRDFCSSIHSNTSKYPKLVVTYRP